MASVALCHHAGAAAFDDRSHGWRKTMPLDIETLLFAAIAIRCGFVVIFAANAHKRRKQTYLLQWFASPAFALGALLGVAMSPDFPQMAAFEGAVVAGLLGLSFALCGSGLRDLLGRPVGIVRAVLIGIVPGAVYAILYVAAGADFAMVGALLGLTLLAAWPIVDLWPQFLRDRLSSQFFVLAALVFYALAFGVTALGLGLDADLQQMTTVILAADSFFSLLLLVNFLAITGERARRSLRDLATVDTLTGLLNRRGFFEIVEMRLHQGAGKSDSTFVVMADIDHFKTINDQLGHDAGDLVLAEFGRRCRGVMQRPGDLAARWGGEEFVIFLGDTTRDDALALAETIRQAVAAEPFKVFGLSRFVTVSAGVATIAQDDHTIEQGIGRADVALYRAKHAGRNRVCFASDLEPSPSLQPANDLDNKMPAVAAAGIRIGSTQN